MSGPNYTGDQFTTETNPANLEDEYKTIVKELRFLRHVTDHTWTSDDETFIDDALVQLLVWGIELDVKSGSLAWLRNNSPGDAETVKANFHSIKTSLKRLLFLLASKNEEKIQAESTEALNRLISDIRNLCDLSNSLQIAISLGKQEGSIAAVKKYMSDWSSKSRQANRDSRESDVDHDFDPNIVSTPSDFLEEIDEPSLGVLDTRQDISDNDAEDIGALLQQYGRYDHLERQFWPDGLLKRILTKERILHNLDESLQAYIDLIIPHGDSNSRLPSEGRVKIFALLTLLEKGDEIRNFIQHGVCDKNLPLSPDAECLQTWRGFEIRCFCREQWGFLVPYLELESDGSPKHYDLDNKTIVPWVLEDSKSALGMHSSAVGSYGVVEYVRIDPEGHGFHENLLETGFDDRLFALKTFHHSRVNTDQAFQREFEMLQKFGGRFRGHLVTALASITFGGRHHILFPQAECNLYEFWSVVQPLPPPADLEESQWISRQLLGLVEALDMLHNPTAQDQADRRYGRHGDIKPNNILCFRSSRDPRGTLVLSDYGLATFNRHESRSDIPNTHVPASPGYRPPECDIPGAVISRAFDVWSLGCVFLDFVTWWLGGNEFLEEFLHYRTTTYITGIKTDIFFDVMKVEEREGLGCQVKPEVIEWIDKLHDHPRCSEFLHDVLGVIQAKMVVVISEVKQRATSTALKRAFREINHKCVNDAVNISYCLGSNLAATVQKPMSTFEVKKGDETAKPEQEMEDIQEEIGTRLRSPRFDTVDAQLSIGGGGRVARSQDESSRRSMEYGIPPNMASGSRPGEFVLPLSLGKTERTMPGAS